MGAPVGKIILSILTSARARIPLHRPNALCVLRLVQIQVNLRSAQHLRGPAHL